MYYRVCRRTGRAFVARTQLFRAVHASILGQSTIRKLWTAGSKVGTRQAEMGAGSSIITAVRAIFLDADFPPAILRRASRRLPRTAAIDNSNGSRAHSGGVHFGRSQNDWNLHFSKDIRLGAELVDMGGAGDLHFPRRSRTRWI